MNNYKNKKEVLKEKVLSKGKRQLLQEILGTKLDKDILEIDALSKILPKL